MYHKSKLSNGVALLTVPVKGTEAVTVLALFPVGSRYETKELNGLSHFIEHMMFKGTLLRPSTLDISKELDKVGAEYNAYTSRDYTGYYIKVSKQHADLAMDLLSDMLWNSKFDAEELKKEKGVIVEELNMYKDNPTMYAEQLFEETLYPNHPLGRDIGGEEKTVRGINQAKMLKYYHDFYEPQNMVLALAGKIDEAMIKKVKKYFSKKGKAIKKQTFKKIVNTKSKGIKAKTFYKKTDQVHVTLGFPAFSFDDPRIPALNLLHVILGGTMSSRLFVEVREKRGLAYMVHSGINRYQETGNLFVRSGLDKSRVAEALKVIMFEFEKIKNEGVTAEELKMAQDNLAGRMILGLEDSSGQAEWYAKQTLLMKQTRTPEEEMKRYRRVTLQDIKKVAQEVIKKDKMRLAVIGPYKSDTEVLNLLK